MGSPSEPRLEVPLYRCRLICLKCGKEWMGPTFTPVRDDEPPRPRQYCDECAEREDAEAAKRAVAFVRQLREPELRLPREPGEE